MKQFIKKASDFVLLGATIVMLVILILFYVWGISSLVIDISAAIAAPRGGGLAVEFNLEDAVQLDLKGLK